MQVSSTVTRSRTRAGSRPRRVRELRAVALGLALALGVTACGGGDDDAALTITSDAEGITGVDGKPADTDTDAGDDAEPNADAGDADAGDADGGDANADSPDAAPATGRQIPAAMPAAIPIPDEHVVLRSEEANYDHSGDFVGVNLAVSGTVDERRAYYRSALEEAYGEVELVPPGGATTESFRFQGDWFELGEIYVDENEGFFDSDTIDTSGLPVIVTIQLSENDDSSD